MLMASISCFALLGKRPNQFVHPIQVNPQNVILSYICTTVQVQVLLAWSFSLFVLAVTLVLETLN
jgi:hypothetical protein